MAKTTKPSYLTVLCGICNSIGSSLDSEKVLNIIVKESVRVLKAKGSTVRLLDEAEERLELGASYGLSKTYLQKGEIKAEKSLLYQEVLKGKVVTILDAARDKRVEYPQYAKKEGICSILCVPLKIKARLLGGLCVFTSTTRKFSKEEVGILSTLAAQGSIAIENARLHQKVCMLYEVGKMVSSTLNLQEVLDAIVRNAVKATNVKGSSLRLLEETRRTLELRAAYGLSREFLEKGPVMADKSITDALKGKPVAIFDAIKDKRVQYPWAAKKEGICSILAVPIAVKGVVIGVLRVYTSVPHKFTKDEVKFLCALADHGAIAIENARLFGHIKKDYDDLAGDVWKWYDWGARPPRL